MRPETQPGLIAPDPTEPSLRDEEREPHAMSAAPYDLVALLGRRADPTPDRLAFSYLGMTQGPTTWTYRGLWDAAGQVARTLSERGIARGDRVLILFPPGLEFIQAFFGSVMAGTIAVPAPTPNPLKPKLSLQRMQSIVESAKPSHVLTLSSVLNTLEPAIAEVPCFGGLGWICVDRLAPNDAPFRPKIPDPNEVALIQYTSGSTADPKGVALTHTHILHNLRYFDVGWDHAPDSVAINWLPAFHDLGLIYGILAPIWGGFLGIQMSPLEVIQQPIAWLRAISSNRATHSCGPNFIYELCVRKVSAAEVASLDLRSWRMALNAAEPVRPRTMHRFAETFAPAGFDPRAFCPGYGLSEGTCKVTAVPWFEAPTYLHLRADRFEHHDVVFTEPGPGALEVVGCGRPGLGVDVVIVDTARQSLGEGRVGEIWVSGPSIATHFWERPEATDESLRAHLVGRDDIPFLRTGDLGFMHDGELFITGRIKDMIIVRGANHYPQDIELTVQDAHPQIRAGGVAAFAIEDDGEAQLVVVAEIDAPISGHFDATEPTTAIVRAVSENHGLRVARAVLIEAHTIPKTTSGKIQRHATKQRLLAGGFAVLSEERPPTAAPDDAVRDQIRARVTDIVSEVGAIPLDRLRPDVSLHGLGVDSLASVNIAYEISIMIDKEVPAELLDEFDTIDRLVDYVVAHKGAR